MINAEDREAFEELYRGSIRRVFQLVARIVGNPSEAEDVTQNAYLQAYRSYSTFAGRSSFFTWMYRIAMNVSLQHVRSRQRRRTHESVADERDGTAVAVSTSYEPEREAARRELLVALRSGIDALPTRQRNVLVLAGIQGRSYAQIGRTLGASVEVIKSRLHRARQSLRSRLAAQDDPPDGFELQRAS